MTTTREPLDGIRATPEELAAFTIAADVFERRWYAEHPEYTRGQGTGTGNVPAVKESPRPWDATPPGLAHGGTP